MDTLNSPITVDETLKRIKAAYQQARKKHKPLNSSHEGYAVLLEEMDELWAEIKSDNWINQRKEVLQIAAMALAYLMEV